MSKKTECLMSWAMLPVVVSGLLAGMLVGRDGWHWQGPTLRVSAGESPTRLRTNHQAAIRSLNSTETVLQATPSPVIRRIAVPSIASARTDQRHQLTYEDWVEMLAREAQVMAERSPDNLAILAGDSISLWFPLELLPDAFTWLNQGISGETSYGLMQRLTLFDDTRPQTILVMIGINDLIRGVKGATVVANQQLIVQHLKSAHPSARIVVQSILPHAVPQAVPSHLNRADNPDRPLWIDSLTQLPNRTIREINEKLARVAAQEGVEFLDLHPAFTDQQGNLRPELTTDGLHLSRAGYQVWRDQLTQALTPAGDRTAVQP